MSKINEIRRNEKILLSLRAAGSDGKNKAHGIRSGSTIEFGDELDSVRLFENRIGLIKAREFCRIFGYSIKTIYEWKYRPEKHKIPSGLIVKFRGKLYLRTTVLKDLIPSIKGD